MAKGDHQRSENRQDEQMKQSQGYLTGIQQNLANQTGNLNNQYFGGGGQQFGGTFGYGSTVPHFSWTGHPYFSGNGTDTPTPIGGGGGQLNEQSFRALFPNGINSDALWNMKDRLAQMGAQVMTNAAGIHGKIKLANGEIVDVIQGSGGSNPRLQWSSDHGIRGGGGGWQSGFGNMGGGGLFGQAQGDYGGLMDMYKGLFGDMGGKYNSFLGSAQNMAQTGGLSAQDQANLRSRAISPIRAVYENSLRNVDRQRALQGGYSPGYTTAMGRFNREMGQGTSDAATNAEAAIAELKQKGMLGGLGAWGSGLSGMGNAMGGILGGMGNLYGTQPGMARLFGDQMLQSMGQQLTAGGLQNQLSLGLLNNQNQISNIAGNYQNALGNIGGTLNLAGRIGGMMYPFLGGGGFGMMGSTPLGGAINPNSMFAGYGA